MHRINRILAALLLFILPGICHSQSILDIAEKFLLESYEELNLSRTDVQNIKLNDAYKSTHNGLSHIFFKQLVDGIEIDDAIINLNIDKDGQVIFLGNRFIKNAASLVNNNRAIVSAQNAIELGASHLGKIIPEELISPMDVSGHEFTFEIPELSDEPIVTQLNYIVKGDELILCWDLIIYEVNSYDVWRMKIDANLGEVIKKENYTLRCFGNAELCHTVGHEHSVEARSLPEKPAFESGMMDATYRVFPLPIENPNDGNHELTSDAQFEGISELGWHDDDGMPGADFTITRGNNVHAYLDEDANNSPDNFVVDGGASLTFDFPFDDALEPEDLREAGLVNMFYTANYMHDFAYLYGFNEEAGNYQDNNYGGGGMDGDYVRAEGNDGNGEDNAVFSISADGVRGRMTMFRWNTPGQGKLRVESPANLAGHIFATGDAEGPMGFGAPITNQPVTGSLALIDSGDGMPDLGCSSAVNPSELNGNIAVITRGVCDFSLKVFHAQEAGAIGAIICNTAENLVAMASGEMAEQITIPSVFIRGSSCDTILNILGNGVVSLVENPIEPPFQKSGMFSNGVIAHEYAHGISTRLTGGPSEPGCLNNDEHMGEGISDFFLLAVTSKSSENGAEARGVGGYLVDDPRGIRRFPYSTDMGVNPQTMDDIRNTNIPHSVGEIWTAATWDMYWQFVEKYGFNPDHTDMESGNAKAMLLIMDGLKMQVCDPGFVEARDAILAADQANFGGENECIIWNSFARRGVGLSADQGDSDNRNDNTEAFDVPVQCQASSTTDELDSETAIKIYPNPSFGEFRVEIKTVHFMESKLGIYTVEGMKIKSMDLDPFVGLNVVDLNLGDLSQGMYIIELSNEKERYTSKLVIY